jgi:hypothetical protein
MSNDSNDQLVSNILDRFEKNRSKLMPKIYNLDTRVVDEVRRLAEGRNISDSKLVNEILKFVLKI